MPRERKAEAGEHRRAREVKQVNRGERESGARQECRPRPGAEPARQAIHREAREREQQNQDGVVGGRPRGGGFDRRERETKEQQVLGEKERVRVRIERQRVETVRARGE